MKILKLSIGLHINKRELLRAFKKDTFCLRIFKLSGDAFSCFLRIYKFSEFCNF
jgi:hypothetical protein